MNIIFFALSLGEGGVSRYIQELSYNMAKAGNNVVLIYQGNCDDYFQSNENYSVIRLPLAKKNFIKRLICTIQNIVKLKNIITDQQNILFVGNTPLSNLIGCILKSVLSNSNIQILRIIHGRWALEIKDLEESKKLYDSRLFAALLPLIARPIERYEISRSDKIIAVSVEIGDYVKSLGINRPVYIIPAGVDTSKFSPSSNKQSIKCDLKIKEYPLVLFVAVLRKIKGLHFLIDAAEIVSKYYKINVIVVGGGPEYEYYLNIVKKRGLTDIIHFTGRLYDDQLRLYYQAADFYCLTSITEGLPQSLLEAMSTGIPSIATSVGGIPDLISSGSNGFLIEPGGHTQLVGILLHLLENPDYAQEVGKKGRNFILDNYSWNTICNQIFIIINGDT